MLFAISNSYSAEKPSRREAMWAKNNNKKKTFAARKLYCLLQNICWRVRKNWFLDSRLKIGQLWHKAILWLFALPDMMDIPTTRLQRWKLREEYLWCLTGKRKWQQFQIRKLTLLPGLCSLKRSSFIRVDKTSSIFISETLKQQRQNKLAIYSE